MIVEGMPVTDSSVSADAIDDPIHIYMDASWQDKSSRVTGVAFNMGAWSLQSWARERASQFLPLEQKPRPSSWLHPLRQEMDGSGVVFLPF